MSAFDVLKARHEIAAITDSLRTGNASRFVQAEAVSTFVRRTQYHHQQRSNLGRQCGRGARFHPLARDQPQDHGSQPENARRAVFAAGVPRFRSLRQDNWRRRHGKYRPARYSNCARLRDEHHRLRHRRGRASGSRPWLSLCAVRRGARGRETDCAASIKRTNAAHGTGLPFARGVHRFELLLA